MIDALFIDLNFQNLPFNYMQLIQEAIDHAWLVNIICNLYKLLLPYIKWGLPEFCGNRQCSQSAFHRLSKRIRGDEWLKRTLKIYCNFNDVIYLDVCNFFGTLRMENTTLYLIKINHRISFHIWKFTIKGRWP